MRAVRLHATGGPEVLRYEEAPTPEPARNEVLIRLRVAAVNRIDLGLREGLVPIAKGFPHILGVDGAGAVVRGSAHDARSGDRVFVSGETLGRTRDGSYAEYVVAPASLVLPIPRELRFEDVAAMGIAALTAWQALVDRGKLEAHQSVLIHGASGAVGTVAVQLAKLLGARVFATAGSEEKLEKLRLLGADGVLSHAHGDVAAGLKALIGNRGVDLVIDLIGGETLGRSLACLAYNGRLVTAGTLAGAGVQVDLRALSGRGLSIVGLNAGALPPHQAADRYRQLNGLLVSGRLHPVIDRILPLAEAAAAHRLLAQRQQFGKILLKI